ncbi:MAG: SAVED domain-containing protein [Acidobacteriota bacterium]
MDYQDFVIDVRSNPTGGFNARVVGSPYRELPEVSFPRPIPIEILAKLRNASDRLKKAADVPSEKDLGKTIHQALFQGELADVFARLRAGLSEGKEGLRIRLLFRLNDSEAEYLAAVPWELLCDAGGKFFSTDLQTPVVRDIQTPHLRGPLTVPPPLRILVVGEQAAGTSDLKVELEIERIREAVSKVEGAGSVEIIPFRNPTVDDLRDWLLHKPVHVLHFIGHGGYRFESSTGALFFVKRDRSEQQVDGEMMADYLKNVPDLRLVVLTACQSARYAGREVPTDCGVASTILERTAIPAVVANQYSISHDAAIDFSAILYGLIAAGWDVDAALTEARMRIRHRPQHGCEWSTPILFLGATDGKLFTVDPNARPAEPIARADVEPVRIGIRSMLGYGKNMEERNDHLLDLSSYFEDNRFIRQQEDWQAEILPRVRNFLLKHADEDRPLVLDLAAHASIAFTAGWVLEAKSGLDVRVRQRTSGEGTIEWHPREGAVPEGAFWLDQPDIVLAEEKHLPDVAVAVAVSQATVPEEVRDFVTRKGLPVGRVLRAVVPEPGPRSVGGGAHALRLAQTLLPRIRQRRPHERNGCNHLFLSGPNAFVFYLGQLSRSLGRVVLYEYPFGQPDPWGKYRRSIELEVPRRALEDW